MLTFVAAGLVILLWFVNRDILEMHMFKDPKYHFQSRKLIDSDEYNVLTTSYTGGISQNGNMFDLISLGSNLKVYEFDIHTSSNSHIFYEVYTREGSYMGNEGSSSDWYLNSCDQSIVGNGLGVGTRIILQSGTTLNDDGSYVRTPISINQGETVGVYITTLAGGQSGNLVYSNDILGNYFVEDSSLRLEAGAAVSYPFDAVFEKR